MDIEKKDKKGKNNKIERLLIDVEKYLSTPEICKCGKNYSYYGLGVYKCDGCGAEFKNEYAIVRDFVDEYGTNYSIIEIAEMTKVSKAVIDLFVRDGKFVTVEKQRMCLICREPIISGTYCNRCALRQIEKSFERKDRKFSSGVLNADMGGKMHHGKKSDKYEEN